MKFSTLHPSTMAKASFVEHFKDIYEHSPWIAEHTYMLLPSINADDIQQLHQLMSDILINASKRQQLRLINVHPDLAGKAAMRNELTASSTDEQAGAGIHQCNPQEFARFTELNKAYKDKFNFPFIMAVKGSNRLQILKAFEIRIHNDIDTEFKQAITEINKIALFRLEAL
ncbi:2-oxo-4-hydroxy-4-carboxy-5-ureidoimidazoline decarboxylase [Neptunomonas japonica]|uniref:2-oxo-4-hydroxy-4-carboxy-5-ureidoimidazoline decarboxylase n=1 Tax=Neptunomonas japonica JAMM 1380 TaxID=1441457 RepID=A0A7R6PTM3_9GAMM|nr:2-oxo-4-hydroxy-4-carboxy-5-ureidoimidazoline decarboxylase [Neptunomonas japonica]BBB29248.1 OHCU decarboxylase [Neptunomonas japonica JAMM 1380]